MQADNSLTSRLEKLARLRVSAAEKPSFSNDLAKVLDMVNKLQEIDTSGIEPLSYPTESETRYRPDEAKDQLSQEEALKNAPKSDSQFFLTPKVID